jgi:hypothetical protein
LAIAIAASLTAAIAGVQPAAAAPACTVTWDGGAGTTAWGTATNWSPDTVPGPTDDVCVPDLSPAEFEVVHTTGADSIHSLQGDGGVQLSAGTLDISGTADPIARFGITGGTLSGIGTLRIGSAGTWSGGSMSGIGTTTVEPGALLNLTGNATLADGRTLEVGGGLSIEGDFNLASAGTPGLLHVLGGGLMRKSVGAGSSEIEPPLDNDGQLQANSTGGTINLSGGSGLGTSTGEFGATVPGAAVAFTAGDHRLGSATFDTGVAIAGATVTIANGQTLAASGISMTAGTLTGGGRLAIIGGTSAWSGGSMSGIGTTTVEPGALLNLTGNATLADGRTLEVGGGLSIEGDFNLASAGTPGLLHVLGGGLMRKSVGAGSSEIEPPLDNDGQLQANSTGGTINLSGGSGLGTSTGEFGATVPGAAVAFTAGDHRLGSATFDTGVAIAGATVTIANGTVTYPSLTQSAGVTNVVDGATFGGPGAALALHGGVLTGSGTVAGDVVDDGGTVRPGSSPGIMTIGGDFTQDAGGNLETEIAGASPGSGYDRLAVAGTATLGGTLAIVTPDPFDPPLSSTYDVLTTASRVGTFDAINGTVLPGKHYAADYLSDRVRLVVTSDTPPPTSSPSPTGDGTTDGTPPRTVVGKSPGKRTRRRTAKFTFTSSEAGSTFRCKLDAQKLTKCRSPMVYKHLKPGKHSFTIEAIDPAGNVDPTPAKKRWTVLP